MTPARTRGFSPTNDLAHRVLVPLLKTRAGRLLGRRLAVIEYDGRRTGRAHRLVAQYVLDRRTVRIGVGRPETKTWWRNFQSTQPAQLWLAGARFDALATVERHGGRVSVVAVLQAPDGR